MKKYFLAFIMAIIMILALQPVTALASFYSDTTDQAIEKWSIMGIVHGSDGQFKPNDPVTAAMLADILGKIMNDPAQSTVTFGLAPSDFVNFTKAAEVLENALGKSDSLLQTVVTVGDDAKTPGVLTRAELVRVLEITIGRIFSIAKSFTGDVSGTAIINTSGVILRDLRINGDLIISAGVGNGDVSLSNVVVTGKLIVRGGGENSIHIAGSSQIAGSVIIEKTVEGSIRVVTEGGAEVAIIVVEDDTDGVILEGCFASVTIDASVPVTVKDNNTVINTLEINYASTIINNGTIGNAIINTNDVFIWGDEPASVEIAENVTGPIDEYGNSVDGIQDVGFLDPTFDYSSAQRYKIAYVYSSPNFVSAMLDSAFQAWANRMNVDYACFPAADAAEFISTLDICVASGYDGFLLDPDATFMTAAVEKMNEIGKPWMSCITPVTDEYGVLRHPFVGFDQYAFGYDMSKWCIDDAKKTGATNENTGMIFIGLDFLDILQSRHMGALAAWSEAGMMNEMFFYGDAFNIGGTDTASAQAYAQQIMTDNPLITNWICCGIIDDMAIGMSDAAAAADKADTTICASVGGLALIPRWDNNTNGSWKAAVSTDPRLYAEPMFCGLYAMITGQVTAETLWPQFGSDGLGNTYASVRIPTIILTEANYKSFLEYVDQYTGINQYPY